MPPDVVAMAATTTAVAEKQIGGDVKDSASATTAIVPALDEGKIDPPDGGLRAWLCVAGG